MILLTGEVITFLVLEGVLLILLTVAAAVAVPILRHWNFQATSDRQYQLENRAYLVGLIITFALGAKIILLPFFAHALDRLAAVVPGAMCAAGVINANSYGFPLLGWKLGVLVLAGGWLLVNRRDVQAINFPHLKPKLGLFLVIAGAVLVESVLDVLYLTGISTLTPVQCCSIIYGVASPAGGLPWGLDTRLLLVLFYLVYLLVLVLSSARYLFLNFLANLGFLVLGYLAVVYFFGTYVYQLPTHQCPFCMLQPEYFYVGFLIWGTLFFGVFLGMAGWLVQLLTGQAVAGTGRWCMVLLTVFTVACTLYPLVYRLRNGVWLT
jgi:hypothetical protein